NSRLVKEQQLLWLDEIQRDPENELLWTEEISLPRPNPIQLIVEDFSTSQKREKITATPRQSRQLRDRRQFARGIMGGAALSLLVIFIGWNVYERVGRGAIVNTENNALSSSSGNAPSRTVSESETASEVSTTRSTPADEAAATDSSAGTATASANDEFATDDPFAQAVMIAQEAVKDGQAASSTAEWLELASRWQRASDLMKQIPASDERYATAQDRQALYRANSEEALLQADLHQQAEAQQPQNITGDE
ncbi:MAG: hypothetical protein VKL39_22310, partial [Leptolyngbyaceae bacterium]|nr:hypothetical protein [Leptolyngbyaceae bacterium]